MSLTAYQTAQKRAETPRETEYRLFTQVTRALVDAQELPRADIGGRIKALDWNRRVWSFLAGDCAGDGNQLPEQLRASIISLSLFVSRHTSEVMQKGAEIEPLVEINRAIMQGLAGQIEAEAVAANGTAPATQPAPPLQQATQAAGARPRDTGSILAAF